MLLGHRAFRACCHRVAASRSRASLVTTAAAAQPAHIHVPKPLCKWPAEHAAKLGSVLAWLHAMEQRIQAIGDRFEQQDGGPAASELQVWVAVVCVHHPTFIANQSCTHTRTHTRT